MTEAEIFSIQGHAVPEIMEEFVGGDGHHLNVVSYQLLPETELDLMEGKMPTGNREILLTKFVASHLLKVDGISSLQDLVGKEIVLTINAVNGGHIFESFTVSGITYMESKFENQVFFADGALDQIYGQIFNYDPDVVTYQYLTFLIDPKLDDEVVANSLSRVLDSKESIFTVYSISTLEAKQEYQNPSAIIVYVLFALLTLLALYIMMNVLVNKRIKKENLILKRYHYYPLIMQITKMIILLTLVAIPQFFFLSYIYDWMSHLANVIGIANIVQYNFINYALSLLMTISVVILLEGGIDIIRIKKHL